MKKALFVLMFLVSSVLIGSETNILVRQEGDTIHWEIKESKPKRSPYLVRLAKQVVHYGIAGFFGFISGLTSGYIDRTVFVHWPITGLFVEPEIRRVLLEDFCDSVEGSSDALNHKRRRAMHCFAWIASWLGYFMGIGMAQSDAASAERAQIFIYGYGRR